MKTLVKLGLIVGLMGALSACGGAASDTEAPPPPATPPGGGTPLATGLFTKASELEASGVGGTEIFFDNGPGGSLDVNFIHAQILYTPERTGGAGNIRGISLRLNEAVVGTASCSGVTIKLGHSSLASLGDTTPPNPPTPVNSNMPDNIDRGALETVLNNATISIAGGITDYFDIDFDSSFNYNGVDALIVDITRNTYCSALAKLRLGLEPTANGAVYVYTIDSGDPDTVGTGLVGNALPHARFHFAGGTNEVLKDYAITAGVRAPLSNDANENKAQMLVRASELLGSGPITGVAMRLCKDSACNPGITSPGANHTVTVRLGHTTRSSLLTTYADNFDVDTPVTVANSVSFRIPAGSPSPAYIWMPFNGSAFEYDGSNNLLMEVEDTTGVTSYWAATSDPGSPAPGDFRSVVGAAAADNGITTLNAYHVKFRFNGATMDVMTANNSFATQPFSDSASGTQIQPLYLSTDLGTKGRIKVLGLRLKNGSVAESYTNLVVTMGHTSKTALALGETFASNMDDATEVFKGTYPISGGLSAGEWLEIPLSTTFPYDGTRNLAVHLKADGGAPGNTNAIEAHIDATLYPSVRTVGGYDNSGASPDWDENGLVTMRLTLE